MKHDNYLELLATVYLSYKPDSVLNKYSVTDSILYAYEDKEAFIKKTQQEGISIEIVDKTLYITIELPA